MTTGPSFVVRNSEGPNDRNANCTEELHCSDGFLTATNADSEPLERDSGSVSGISGHLGDDFLERLRTLSMKEQAQIDASTGKSRSCEEDVPNSQILLQAETRPLSSEQLEVELGGIYDGLVMVEKKCIDVDEKQSTAAQETDPTQRTMLTYEQWRALIALHKTLLHEHHDFFLASQHPAASSTLSNLAETHDLPARMWRHGIHGFLKVLSYGLPESREHMLAFIYIAYSMMTLMYETVPSFQNTWIECLGDLGRYRMAIEDDDMQDRETWSGVSWFWYSQASDKSPQVGKYYHHLAILARPYTISQLSLYGRSLTCEVPFLNARDSIMTLFNPILESRSSILSSSNLVEVIIIRLNAVIFTGRRDEYFNKDLADLVSSGLLNRYISEAGSKFRDLGVAVALANIASMLGYGTSTPKGTPQGVLRLLIEAAEPSTASKANNSDNSKDSETVELGRPSIESLTSQQLAESKNKLAHASVMSFQILKAVLNRKGDKNVHPLVHVYVVFIWYLTGIPGGVEQIETDVPWLSLITFLNTLIRTPSIDFGKVEAPAVPGSEIGAKWRPLYEDFLLRGQLYYRGYIPHDPCEVAAIDDDERTLELASMQVLRVQRILWACHKIASRNKWIGFDPITKRFSVSEAWSSLQMDKEMGGSASIKEEPQSPSSSEDGISKEWLLV